MTTRDSPTSNGMTFGLLTDDEVEECFDNIEYCAARGGTAKSSDTLRAHIAELKRQLGVAVTGLAAVAEAERRAPETGEVLYVKPGDLHRYTEGCDDPDCDEPACVPVRRVKPPHDNGR